MTAPNEATVEEEQEENGNMPELGAQKTSDAKSNDEITEQKE